MTNPDPISVFRTEAAELLEQVESGLLDLTRSLDDRNQIDAVFRGLHTLKGSGAMFGFDQLAAFTHRYVMTRRDGARDEVRIHPRLRSTIGFGRMNLMDSAYKVGEPMHMIFCRNVLIYFDKPTQAKVLSRLCDCLVPGGYLYVGHSETVTGISLPVRQVANTVFKKI